MHGSGAPDALGNATATPQMLRIPDVGPRGNVLIVSIREHKHASIQIRVAIRFKILEPVYSRQRFCRV